MMPSYHVTEIDGWIVDMQVEKDGTTSGSIRKEGNSVIGSSLAWLFNEDAVYDQFDNPVKVSPSLVKKVREWADLHEW